jgi:polyvinyl alcohol dehydrogenase (cytochrome)
VWKVEGVTGVSSTPAVVDGVVYYGDWKGVVHAADAATGKDRWTQSVHTQVMASPTVTDDAVLVTDNSTLFRLDRETGAIEWEAKTSDHPIAISPASPVVVDDVVIQGVASGELMVPLDSYSFRGSVAGYDLATGAERWKVWLTDKDETGGAGVGVWSTPSVDRERGLLYVGSGNTYEPPASPRSDSILAIRYATGEVAWVRQFTYPDVWSTGHTGGVDGDVGAGPNLWEVDGRALVGAGDKRGVFHALDRDTGEVVWEATLTPGSVLGGVIGTAAHGEGRIYVASNVGNADTNTPTGSSKVLALDERDGTVLWSVELPGTVYAPVTTVPGVVLVGTTAATMAAFDAATGTTLWSTTAPDQVGGGATVVDGTVYWGYGFALFGSGSGNGGLVAMRPTAGGPGSTPTGSTAGGTGGESKAAELYRTVCASCHGLRGEGGVGADLRQVEDKLTVDQHLEAVRNGRPGTQMPAFGTSLTDEEIRQIVEYERTQL